MDPAADVGTVPGCRSRLFPMWLLGSCFIYLFTRCFSLPEPGAAPVQRVTEEPHPDLHPVTPELGEATLGTPRAFRSLPRQLCQRAQRASATLVLLAGCYLQHRNNNNNNYNYNNNGAKWRQQRWWSSRAKADSKGNLEKVA